MISSFVLAVIHRIKCVTEFERAAGKGQYLPGMRGADRQDKRQISESFAPDGAACAILHAPNFPGFS